MAAAALVPEVAAAAPFYGIPSSDLADVTKIKIPLQCHFGDADDVSCCGVRVLVRCVELKRVGNVLDLKGLEMCWI